jgi:aldose 1-epimerase
MEKREFGTTANGKNASLYTLRNANGMQVAVTDYGATLVSILVENKNGKTVDVLLGYDDVTGYENGTYYFGATVGRSCNRIAGARFSIDGQEYKLEANDNQNSLHSGSQSTAMRLWEVTEHTRNRLTMQIEDADLQQGFPGNARIQVTFALTPDNALAITYSARADKKTVFNLTNHAYFNLNGAGGGSIREHVLQLQASAFTPTDAQSIPTGEIRPVEGTPFDFREGKAIGRDIEMADEQLTFGSGYDHNFALDKEAGTFDKFASVYSERSGIRMDVSTDCPGVQLYTGNFIDGALGKGGNVYEKRDGLCLETQYFPNSINEPNFATPLTDVGETYESHTVYAFFVED